MQSEKFESPGFEPSTRAAPQHYLSHQKGLKPKHPSFEEKRLIH